MPRFRRPKGTRDLGPAAAARFEEIRETFVDMAWEMGYRLVDVPALESRDLFARSTGEDTEIVEKQMYGLVDGGGRELALRPEGTPGLVRAAIEEGWLGGHNGERLAYFGPMFRYERPQKGRYRQFTQLGVEFLGIPGPEADAEVIRLLVSLLGELEIPHTLKLNTLGSPAERAAYTETLRDWLAEREMDLDEADRHNIARNPLRVLDSKREATMAATARAPRLDETVGDESAARFARVRGLLEKAGVDHEVDSRLVRGLDYYGHTVFEAVGREAAQDAYGGGGRYDGLVTALGGPDTPAVGFAAGVDRLAADGTFDDPEPPLWLVPLGEAARGAAWPLAAGLWEEGVAVQVAWNETGLRKALGRADTAGVRWVLILGDEEAEAGEVTLRDMAGGTQGRLPADAAALVAAMEDAE